MLAVSGDWKNIRVYLPMLPHHLQSDTPINSMSDDLNRSKMNIEFTRGIAKIVRVVYMHGAVGIVTCMAGAVVAACAYNDYANEMERRKDMPK
jgi:hypothetical protein